MSASAWNNFLDILMLLLLFYLILCLAIVRVFKERNLNGNIASVKSVSHETNDSWPFQKMDWLSLEYDRHLPFSMRRHKCVEYVNNISIDDLYCFSIVGNKHSDWRNIKSIITLLDLFVSFLLLKITFLCSFR